MSKLLTAKHWQLFVLTFALPFTSYLIGIIVFVIGMFHFHDTQSYDTYPPPGPDLSYFIPLIIAALIAMGGGIVHLIWMYKCGVDLQPFMAAGMRRLKVRRFKIFFFSPFIYLALLMILTPFLFSIPGRYEHSMPVGLIVLFVFMLLGHMYSAFCGIYVLYFTAKTIKSAELQREAHFSDYIGEFFMIWFYPIGIWFLQPKINKIINSEQKPADHSAGNIVDSDKF